MNEKITSDQMIEKKSTGDVIKEFWRHRGRFGIVAGVATIGLEKFLYEAITKHGHLSRSEVPIHVIADIAGCFLGEKVASAFTKKYSQAISLAINGTTHAIYEVGHHSMHHTHGHEHENHNHTLLLLALITIKIIGEQWYHHQQHKTEVLHEQ